MPDSLQNPTSNSVDKQHNDFWSSLSWKHPLVHFFMFLFGDIVGFYGWVKSGSDLAFGIFIGLSIALLISSVLVLMDYRRKQKYEPKFSDYLKYDSKEVKQAETIHLNEQIQTQIENIPETVEKPIEEPHSEEKIVEKTTPLERPNLITSLVIDSVSENKVDFHLQLENKGKAIAKNILTNLYTDRVQRIENTPPMTRSLPPEGKLSIPEGAPGVIRPNKITSLIVKVFYSVEDNGEAKPFSQTLRFLIRPEDIKIQTINPEAWEEKEGDNPTEDEGLIQSLAQFTQPQGTMALILPEIASNGNPNILHWGNQFRVFSFDALAQIVSFKTKTDSGRLVSFDLPFLPNEKKLHIIMLMWSPKGGFLRVDMTEKEDFEKETK